MKYFLVFSALVSARAHPNLRNARRLDYEHYSCRQNNSIAFFFGVVVDQAFLQMVDDEASAIEEVHARFSEASIMYEHNFGFSLHAEEIVFLTADSPLDGCAGSLRRRLRRLHKSMSDGGSDSMRDNYAAWILFTGCSYAGSTPETRRGGVATDGKLCTRTHDVEKEDDTKSDSADQDDSDSVSPETTDEAPESTDQMPESTADLSPEVTDQVTEMTDQIPEATAQSPEAAARRPKRKSKKSKSRSGTAEDAAAALLAVSSDVSGDARNLAHEIGHLFGALHVFEGVGKLERESDNGIMDYGSQEWNGEVQFHEIHEKTMCAVIHIVLGEEQDSTVMTRFQDKFGNATPLSAFREEGLRNSCVGPFTQRIRPFKLSSTALTLIGGAAALVCGITLILLCSCMTKKKGYHQYATRRTSTGKCCLPRKGKKENEAATVPPEINSGVPSSRNIVLA